MKDNKRRKHLFSFLLCLILLSGSFTAKAAETEDFYAGKTWDELAQLVLSEADADDGCVALGYCNTVTGEEHYYNADTYFTGASLYKLPLNMYCAEQVCRGERSWDSKTNGHSYEEIQVSSLTYSNNPHSLQLVRELGGWVEFRANIAPYMNEDPNDEDFCSHFNHFTARQMTTCTALLARESERFPRVIDCLLDSAPESFLNYADVPYDIAQKYGNNPDEGNVFHVAGIVYTDDPIVLVVLSTNLAAQRTLMARYCELMCGYSQYQRALRLEKEAEEQRLAEEAAREAEEQAAAEKAAEEEALRLAREAEEERLAREEAIRQAAEEAARERAEARQRRLTFLLLSGGAVLITAGFILVSRKRKP